MESGSKFFNAELKIKDGAAEPVKNTLKSGKGILLDSILVPDQIKKELFVLVGLWSASLNFKSYTEDYFPAELYEFNQSQKVDYTEFPQFAQGKNSFIKQEIEGINDRLSEIKKIFEKYHISATPRIITSYLKVYKLEPDHEDFLKTLSESTLDLSELELIIKGKLAGITFGEVLHICAIIYFDLFKIHTFLLSQLIPDVSEVPVIPAQPIKEDIENNDATASKDLSALETAYLAHYLVESKEYTFINGTPGEMDWEYFSKITNGASSTNIRKSYGEILKTDKRLKTSRISKIKKVILYLKTFLPGNKEAILKAEQELQIVEQKLL